MMSQFLKVSVIKIGQNTVGATVGISGLFVGCKLGSLGTVGVVLGWAEGELLGSVYVGP